MTSYRKWAEPTRRTQLRQCVDRLSSSYYTSIWELTSRCGYQRQQSNGESRLHTSQQSSAQTKPKDVDVVVLDPANGPLVIVGVRSQMSSVGNNVLTYYEGIVGECISLQDRFPMAVHGYVYLHPFRPIKAGKEDQKIDHTRYAPMYEAITERHPAFYKTQRGVFDVFAYMVVDFEENPPVLHDDILSKAGLVKDLRLEAFVDGIVSCFKKRELFIDLFS